MRWPTLALTLAVGCFGSSDDPAPMESDAGEIGDSRTLGIELFWDGDPSPDAFLGGTCASAGVVGMSWSLTASDGLEVAGRQDQSCRDRIEITDVEPSDYTLEVTGFDADAHEAWYTLCTGIVKGEGADEPYICDIHSLP